jgi:hypothetical protein
MLIIGLAVALGVSLFIIFWMLFHKKYSGALNIGFNSSTGREVYQFEFYIPIDEVKNKNHILIKVNRTNADLGINQRLYDLNEEGINRESNNPYNGKEI